MADDLWRECAAWLTRCSVIPPDHKANGPDSEIRVLALTLRDGVLLCNLLNFIDANALDMKDFNRKPQMAQVCEHPHPHLHTHIISFYSRIQFTFCISLAQFVECEEYALVAPKTCESSICDGFNGIRNKNCVNLIVPQSACNNQYQLRHRNKANDGNHSENRI